MGELSTVFPVTVGESEGGGVPCGLPSTFTYTEARRAGMSKRRLYTLRDTGDLELVGHGLYRRVDAELADVDLVEVAHRAPEATLCLTSALARHGLSDAFTGPYEVALPRGRRHPAVTAPVRWHSFDRVTFTVGRTLLWLDADTALGLYGPERSIVDAFRLRGVVGADLAYEALRRWLRGGGEPGQLLDTAAFFPASVPGLRSALTLLL